MKFKLRQISTLLESLEQGTKYKCLIIKAGTTSSPNTYAEYQGRRVPVKKNYSKEVLQEAVAQGLFDNIPMLLRSEDEHLNDKNKSVDNIVGIFTGAYYDEEQDGIVATLNIKKGKGLSESFRKGLVNLWNDTKELGLSIYGFGKWIVNRVQNEYVATVTALEEIVTVDPCRQGNAGGKILALVESHKLINTFDNQKPKTMFTDKQRKAIFLFLVTTGVLASTMKIEDVSDKELTDKISSEDLAKVLNEVEKEPVEKKEPDEKKEPTPPVPDNGKKEFTPPAPDDKTPAKTESEKELENTLAEAKKLLAEANFQKIISQSKLPKNALDKIEARYKANGYNYTDESLKQELKDVAELLAEANPKKPFPFQDIKVEQEQGDKYQLACDWLFMSDHLRRSLTEAERKKFVDAGVTGIRSFRKFYEEITGDTEVSGMYSRERMAEAIITTTFPEMLGVSIHRAMIRQFNQSAYNQDWRKICTIGSRGDYKENTRSYVGGYGDVPVVTEGNAYTSATTPAEEAVKSTMIKRGYTESVTREAILNDDINFLQRIPVKFGNASARTLYKFVFGLITANPTMLYDSKTLFHADHNNVTTVALDSTGLATMRSLLYNQVDLTNAEKMGLILKYILIPDTLRATAYGLVTPSYNQNNETPTFIQTLNIEPIICPQFTDPTDWYGLVDPAESPVLAIDFLNGNQEPDILIQDTPNVGTVFTHDKITWRLRHEYTGVVENHRGVAKSTVADA